MRLLGISCSLRNARYGAGSDALIDDITKIADKDNLLSYLESQTKIRADDFISAGRGDGQPFDRIYSELRKMRGDRGLSNSEAALVAGLWGAHRAGAQIKHVGLSTFFPMTGDSRALGVLRNLILESDAILVSGPVYFGDRGSLAQELFEFLHADPDCAAHVRDRLYAGIAVGAKRNGGQETTLIYQIVDATNLNMLAVGNDDKTTSQYGGTAVAGDVGTFHEDAYGIETCIGTGHRLVQVGRMLEAGKESRLRDKVKIQIWLLQDRPDRYGYRQMREVAEQMMVGNDGIDVEVLDFTQSLIYRCIACDICPIDVGVRDQYRCIINAGKDAFVDQHAKLIQADAVLLGAYSPIDRKNVRSVYQRFMERTRYLRRDDYALADQLVAPLVISELNANQNLHIRMLTSFVRHQTVLHHPLIGYEQAGVILNLESFHAQARNFAKNAIRMTTGRLAMSPENAFDHSYNPIGYIISKEKKAEDQASGVVREIEDSRREIQNQDRTRRVL